MKNKFIESTLNYRYRVNLYLDLLENNNYFITEDDSLKSKILNETINQMNAICEGKQKYPEELSIKKKRKFKQLNESGGLVARVVKALGLGGAEAAKVAEVGAKGAEAAAKGTETTRIAPRGDIVVQPPKGGPEIQVEPVKPQESDVLSQLGKPQVTATTRPQAVKPAVGAEEISRMTAAAAQKKIGQLYSERALKYAREGLKGDELHKAIMDDLIKNDPIFKSADPEMKKMIEATTKAEYLAPIRAEAEAVGVGGEQSFLKQYEVKPVGLSKEEEILRLQGKDYMLSGEARVAKRVEELNKLRQAQQKAEPLIRAIENRPGLTDDLERLQKQLADNIRRQEELSRELGELGVERAYSKPKSIEGGEMGPPKPAEPPTPPAPSKGSEVTPKVDDLTGKSKPEAPEAEVMGPPKPAEPSAPSSTTTEPRRPMTDAERAQARREERAAKDPEYAKTLAEREAERLARQKEYERRQREASAAAAAKSEKTAETGATPAPSTGTTSTPAPASTTATTAETSGAKTTETTTATKAETAVKPSETTKVETTTAETTSTRTDAVPEVRTNKVPDGEGPPPPKKKTDTPPGPPNKPPPPPPPKPPIGGVPNPDRTIPPISLSQSYGQPTRERGDVQNINVNLAVDSLGGKYSRFLRIA